MTSILQRIAKTAVEAYGLRSNDKKFSPKFVKMGEMMRRVQAPDINLNPELEDMIDILNENTEENPPVAYVPICEHEKFTMSMFVLKKGAQIPLHDHPGMYGIIKVLRGNILVHSYSADDSEPEELGGDLRFPARKFTEALVGEADSECLVLPKDNNYHEITAPNGAAAFLDVLFPPYHEDNRVCNYYKVLKSSEKEARVILQRIPPPPHFWTIQISKYVGPELNNL